MKNVVVVLSLILILPILAFGQSSNLFDLYEIPEFTYQSTVLNAPYLFDYYKSTTVEEGVENRTSKTIQSNIDLDFLQFTQNPSGTTELRGRASTDYYDYKYKSQWSTNEEKYLNIGVLLKGTRTQYFDDERGLFFHGTLAFLEQYDIENETRTTILSAPLGVGYGRVIAIRSVAQAHVIDDELDLNLSDEQVIELAHLIDKFNAGYYYAEYKDDAEIAFFDDVAVISGKPEGTVKIARIMGSSLYKTTARYVGWEIRMGLMSNYIDVSYKNSSSSAFQANLFASLEYALPIDMDKQFRASVNYVKPLGDDPDLYADSYLEADAGFTIDHNYTWSSALNVDYTIMMPEVGDNLSNLRLSTSTDYALLNSLSIVASISHDIYELGSSSASGNWDIPFYVPASVGYENTTSTFRLGFRYYIN